MAVIVLCGPNGCGKGVQSEFLKKAGYDGYLSMGDKCRALQPGAVSAGALAGDDFVNGVFMEWLSNITPEDRATVDGYPRTVVQARFLLNSIDSFGLKGEVIVLNFVLPWRIARDRCLGRNRGSDDNPEVLERRWQVYCREIIPAIEELKVGLGRTHFFDIDATGSPEDIFDSIVSCLQPKYV